MRLPIDLLNPPQREAVLHPGGPLLVLAGAGSGKTRVVTMRLARLLLEGHAARSLLAVTFTNKAAKEMKERLIQLVGKARARGVVVSTFHSLCARLLRRDAHRIDLSPGFTILDSSDQLAQLMRIAKEEGVELEEISPKMVLARIGYFKNQGQLPGAVPPPADEVGLLGLRLYAPYQKHLRSLQAVDFDDLLLLARELLEQAPDVRDRYRHLFQHVLIDEYQDTNPLQFDLVRLLVGPHRNLCVVGDDDQAIYGFRGASVDNILSFDQHFSPCTVVKLEQNYRSTQLILDAANHVIAKNTGRKEKSLFSGLGAGEPPRIVACATGEEEARFVASEIARLMAVGEVEPDDVALLYRANPQSRLFEEHLRLEGVPYRVVGGQEFFERREVKDALAYLALIARPDDELAFRRVVNLPSRGLGDVAVARVLFTARERGVSLIDHGAEGALGAGLKPAQIDALEGFCRPLKMARERLADPSWDGDIAELCEAALRRAGLDDLLAKEKDLKTRERIQDAFEELFTALSSFSERVRDAEESPDLAESWLLEESASKDPLAAFLDRVALEEEQREKDRQKEKQNEDKKDAGHKKSGKVTLMTFHASKGLEYPHVFFVGFEEGLMPHRRVIEEGEDGVSEERRLCYVGITRAQRRLTFTWAKARKRRRELVRREISRFAHDLPDGLVVREDPERPLSEEQEQAAAAGFFAKMRAQLSD